MDESKGRSRRARHFVRQRPARQSRAVRRAEREGVCSGGRELRDREKRRSTAGVRCRVDDGSTCLLAERARIKSRCGHHVEDVGIEREKPLLETAEILHAGDDFLARITALLEIDAAEKIPIRRLRHEEVGRRCRDPRHAGGNAMPSLHVVFDDARMARDRRTQDPHVRGRGHDRDASIGQHEGTRAVVECLRDERCRHDAECVARSRGIAGAGEADQRMARTRVVDRHLGAQHEHREPAPDGFGEIGREQHDDSGFRLVRRRAPQYAVGKHAAFWRVVAPVLTFARGERADVARKLPLEKLRRIVAGHAQYAPADVGTGDGGGRYAGGGESEAGLGAVHRVSERGRADGCAKGCRARITSYRGCPFTSIVRETVPGAAADAPDGATTCSRRLSIRCNPGRCCSRHRPHRTPAFQGGGPCQSRRPNAIRRWRPNPEELGMSVTMRQMLEAGVHFGHQTRYWNPKMADYIFGQRNKIHIVNLEKTMAMYQEAIKYIRQLATNRGTILFVGTKRQAREIVAEEAQRCGMPYVDHRWLGGMLSNFKTVKQSVKRLKDLDAMKEDGTFDRMTKREALSLTREQDKLRKSLGGIKTM